MTDDARLLHAANSLMQARRSGTPLEALAPDTRPQSTEQAYAIQDLQLRKQEPVAAWKVGAKDATAEPTCAALSGATVFRNNDALLVPHLRIQGVEVELGVVLGADLPARAQPYTEDEVMQALGAVCVAVEIVDSRFQNFAHIDPLSKLADFSSHGLVVYAESGIGPSKINDWSRPHASLAIGQGPRQEGPSQNPGGDARRLLVWLANHASRRGCGLRRGQLVITGSCFPMAAAAPGQSVQAQVAGLPALEIRLPGGA